MSSVVLASSVSPRPVSLSSLPIEIKTQIVKFAKLQDNRYDARLWSDKANVRSLAEIPTRADPDWKGESLLSLHLVNKEFSSLAAAEIFYQLKSSETDDGFQRSILPHHFNHIQSLELDANSDSEDIEYALSISLLLPSLKELRVSIGCASLTRNTLLYSFLGPLRSKIQSLSITDESLSNIAEFIRRFPNLEKLSISQVGAETSSSFRPVDFVSVGTTISELKELRRLTLNAVDIKRLHQEWSTLDWNKSSLLSLTILSKTKSALAVPLATLFSHSLETLRIESTEDSSVKTDFPRRHTFPLLRHLTLTSRHAVLSPLLLSFSFPSIRHLEFKLNNFSATSQKQFVATINTIISSHPHLRSLKLETSFVGARHHILSSSYLKPQNNLRILLKDNLDVANLPRESSLRVEPIHPALREQLSDALVKSFTKVLDFGKILFEEVAKEGDNEVLYQMGEKLDWIRAEMEERKD